jgi:hypothetical protein
MHEGLLWFDADPKRALNEKVAQAADRYRHKFGRKPNLCYINPMMLPGSEPAECNGVRLVPSRAVLKHHFWIGVEDAAELSRAAH